MKIYFMSFSRSLSSRAPNSSPCRVYGLQRKRTIFVRRSFFFLFRWNGIDLNFLCKFGDDEIKINCIIVDEMEEL